VNTKGLVAFGFSAALVVTGVLLEGSEQNPWNLVMAYIFSVGTVEAVAVRPSLWRYGLCALVLGVSIYGAVWTLGAQHAAAPRAALVYVGLVGGVLSALVAPLRGRQTPTVPGA
jgi:hypothetical protein